MVAFNRQPMIPVPVARERFAKLLGELLKLLPEAERCEAEQQVWRNFNELAEQWTRDAAIDRIIFGEAGNE